MTLSRRLSVGALALCLAGCAELQTSDVTGVTGGTLGGVFGGLAGSQFGSGTGQLVTTALGSSLGALFGGAAGRSIGNSIESSPSYQGGFGDPYQSASYSPSGGGSDQAYVQEALTVAGDLPIGSGVSWDNPGSGSFGTVTAIREGRAAGGQYCREFENSAIVNGGETLSYAVACQFPDGSWRSVQ